MNEHLFNTLRELAKDSTLSQRDLSQKMWLSLGRVNYIVNALVEKGYIKAERFKNSKNKMAYMYILTPKGVKEKIMQTQMFLTQKSEEFERLKQEIDMLRIEDALTRKHVNAFHDQE
jgi:EPS-associated MarR family transcriptional regulator